MNRHFLRFASLAAMLAHASTSTAQTPAPPKLGGYIQVRETAAERVSTAASLNRARFSIDGPLPSGFTYKVLFEMEAPAGARAPATPSLREATIKWTRNSLSVTAGQFKTPFTREYLIPVPVLETADLAAVIDSLAPKYDVGVMVEYAICATVTRIATTAAGTCSRDIVYVRRCRSSGATRTSSAPRSATHAACARHMPA